MATQTTTARPWGGLRPHLEDLYGEASNLAQSQQGQTYGGDFVAGPSPTQTQGLDYARSLVPSLSGLGGGAIQLGQDTLAGNYLNPQTNPHLQGGINAAIAPLQENFERVLMPQLQSQAIAQGAYTGNAPSISAAIAGQDLSRTIGDVSSSMALDAYNRERQLQHMAPQLISQGSSLELLPADILGQIGGQERQFTQDALNNAVQQFQHQQGQPWVPLTNLSSILQGGGAAGSGQTTTTQESGGAPSWLQGALGGAGLGATFGNLLGGATGGGLIPWALGGAGLGGLLGAF